MDNLQYGIKQLSVEELKGGFKPYYKWIIFNIKLVKIEMTAKQEGFKPYYKWIIFNIYYRRFKNISFCSFKPYYKWIIFNILFILLSSYLFFKF